MLAGTLPSSPTVGCSRSSRRSTAPHRRADRPLHPRSRAAGLICRAEGESSTSGDQGDGNPTTNVSLRIPYHVHYGQCLAVVGSGEHLGNWNPGSAIRMNWTEGDYWVVEMQLRTTSECELEYKYLVLNDDGYVGMWKPGENFKLDIPAGARVKVLETWVDGPRHVEMDMNGLMITSQSSQQEETSPRTAIQQQTDQAMSQLEAALESQCATLERSKDPASNDLINGDRILAAASNKAMAFNKAVKAADILPQLPGSSLEQGSMESLNP